MSIPKSQADRSFQMLAKSTFSTEDKEVHI